MVKEEEQPAKVVNLMEALKKSLAAVSEAKKKPAKADLKAPAEKAEPAAKKKARKSA